MNQGDICPECGYRRDSEECRAITHEGKDCEPGEPCPECGEETWEWYLCQHCDRVFCLWCYRSHNHQKEHADAA